MATPNTKRRNIVRRLLWMLVGAILLLASLPVWFPWVLRPVLNYYDFSYGGYDRTGYTRFALNDVTAGWDSARLKVKSVECVLPTAWFWKAFVSGTSASPLLTVRSGELVIAREMKEAEKAKVGSLGQTLDQGVRIAAMLERMLPVAELTNCTIQVASNRVLFPRVDWRDGRMQALIKLPASPGEIRVTGRLEKSSSVRLSADWDAYNSSVRGEFSRTAAGWRWDGEANWLTNRAELSAQFATNGWWPVRAQLSCPELIVPAKLVHLRGYEELTAVLAVNLSSNQFSLQATGFARPANDFAARGFPAAHFSVAVNGNPYGANFHTFEIQSPGLNVELTSPVAVTWQDGLVANPAQLQIVADLSKLPGATLTGRAEGVVRVELHGQQPPTAQFNFLATNFRAWRIEAESVLIKGEFASPELRLDELKADLRDGSKLAATGSFDFQTREIVKGSWKFSGGFLKIILPGSTYDTLAGFGELHGPLTNLSHSGEVAVKGFRENWLNALDANAKWSGRNLRLDSVDVEMTSGASALSIGGAVDLSALNERKISATWTNVSLRGGKQELYALEHPCAISFTAAGTNGSRNWTFAVDAFNWQGVNRQFSLMADLSWPARGIVKAAMTNVALTDFSDFLTPVIPNLSLASLEVAAHWTNGPVHAAMFVAGALTNLAGQPFLMRGALAAGETLLIKQLSVESGYTPTLSVTGNVPVKVVPGRAGALLEWDESQTLELMGNWETQPSQTFSLPLAAHGELHIANPELHFRIEGTPDNPSASFKAHAAAVSWPSSTNFSLFPKVEDLQLSAEIRPDGVKLETVGAKLDGQLIEATGEWPLKPGTWRTLWSDRKLPDWTQAHGRLQLDGAQMAALARYLPQILAPAGQLSARLELKAGKQFDGYVSLTNASTRALGTLTPLRDISAQAKFDSHRAVLENFQGQIGGQPVLADGILTLRDQGGPDYRLHLRGTNVPLVRSPELMLRGDFDVQLHGGSNQPPMLSGGVNLHDGLFLQHASALVWSRPKRPGMRPPYFSVTNAPLADWRLDLAIDGDRFLRVRTPVFSGSLSADLKLKGSLRQPELTGDVRANSGRVLFPFGTLHVNQGYASFSGHDPQGPDLQLSASGRNYRYEIQLDVKGPADGAEMRFSSTPPLTSEQILLMLTAGELPQSDFAFSSEARAGRLATFLGRDFLSRFLGGDRAEERLIVRTGESISQEGQLTYSVEYRLTDRWSIIGEYDEFNAFNTDLKWKIFTR